VSQVKVIGGGLAGTEAAWQLAQRGVSVKLYEMRPKKTTGAHVSDRLAELVCSTQTVEISAHRLCGKIFRCRWWCAGG
jgi:folate-dependent tRNA-U54 methylase TrmFO/GidA